MTSKPIVGITQRIDVVRGRDERRDAIDQKLVQWLSCAGVIPVAVPNALLGGSPPVEAHRYSALSDWLDATQPRALILSGGNDIGEFPDRDETERYLLTWAEVNHVPVLGICRGMQMLGLWAGGELKPVEGHVRTHHKLPNRAMGRVNSFHNFSLSDCPRGFEVIDRAEDGEIEAIRHKSLPWEGWMWHPEREESFSSLDIDRLKRLLKK